MIMTITGLLMMIFFTTYESVLIGGTLIAGRWGSHYDFKRKLKRFER
jgi:NADH:ubiquinone oxidoreductase subunit 4 (subunit M)